MKGSANFQSMQTKNHLPPLHQSQLKGETIETNNPTNEEFQVTKVQRKRKQQNLALFWACIICNMLLSYLNLPIFLMTDVMTLSILTIVIVIITYIVYIANSCILAETKADVCYLYLLFDSIFVAKCTAIVGLFGLLMVMLPMQVPVMMMAVLINMDLFIFSGNCRVILAYCKYKRWQVLLFKMTIACCLFLYLILAAYYMANPSSIPGPKESQDKIANFFFLYVFGLFTLYLEIFIKISDIDGTHDLQYHYHMNYDDEIGVTLVNGNKIHDEEEKAQKKKSNYGKPAQISFD